MAFGFPGPGFCPESRLLFFWVVPLDSCGISSSAGDSALTVPLARQADSFSVGSALRLATNPSLPEFWGVSRRFRLS